MRLRLVLRRTRESKQSFNLRRVEAEVACRLASRQPTHTPVSIHPLFLKKYKFLYHKFTSKMAPEQALDSLGKLEKAGVAQICTLNNSSGFSFQAELELGVPGRASQEGRAIRLGCPSRRAAVCRAGARRSRMIRHKPNFRKATRITFDCAWNSGDRIVG